MMQLINFKQKGFLTFFGVKYHMLTAVIDEVSGHCTSNENHLTQQAN